MTEKLIVGLIGVVTRVLGVMLKSWLQSRMKLDESTRAERWTAYKKLWLLTKCLPKWPRDTSLTNEGLLKFSGLCRDWYFSEAASTFQARRRKLMAICRMQ